jgi:hypothetical protein
MNRKCDETLLCVINGFAYVTPLRTVLLWLLVLEIRNLMKGKCDRNYFCTTKNFAQVGHAGLCYG